MKYPFITELVLGDGQQSLIAKESFGLYMSD